MDTEIERISTKIDEVKLRLSTPSGDAQLARGLALQLRDLHQQLKGAKDRAGFAPTMDDLETQLEGARQRIADLGQEPSKTDIFRMMGLANKVERLQAELGRRRKAERRRSTRPLNGG